MRPHAPSGLALGAILGLSLVLAGCAGIFGGGAGGYGSSTQCLEAARSHCAADAAMESGPGASGDLETARQLAYQRCLEAARTRCAGGR